LIILLDYFIAMWCLGRYGLWGSAIAWALFSAACSATVVWAAGLLGRSMNRLGQSIELPEAEFERWYEDRIRFSFYSKWTLFISLSVVLFFSLTILVFGAELCGGDSRLSLIRSAILIPSVFGPGLMWPMVIGTCVLGHKTATLPIRAPIGQDPENSISTLGSLFLRLMIAVAVCYILALFVLVLSPVAGNLIAIVWAGATAVAILLGFVLPQVGVHRVMVREKRRRLKTIDGHLNKGIHQVLLDPRPEILMHVAYLLEISNFLKGMKEWPFSWNAVWQLTTAVFVPFLLALVPMIWR
jgi:hypothetical protein